jgi:hypothetical protein
MTQQRNEKALAVSSYGIIVKINGCWFGHLDLQSLSPQMLCHFLCATVALQ